MNLVLLCQFHHDLIHHGQWTVSITDGRQSVPDVHREPHGAIARALGQ